VDECKPLAAGGTDEESPWVSVPAMRVTGTGLHLSTFRLNISAFCGIRGA
jgi:hypothetical protein